MIIVVVVVDAVFVIIIFILYFNIKLLVYHDYNIWNDLVAIADVYF